jgi:hypothetical protein
MFYWFNYMVYLGSLKEVVCTQLWIFKQIRNICCKIP